MSYKSNSKKKQRAEQRKEAASKVSPYTQEKRELLLQAARARTETAEIRKQIAEAQLNKQTEREYNKNINIIGGASDVVKGLSGIAESFVKNTSPLISTTSGDFTAFSSPQKATMIMKLANVIRTPIYNQTIGRPCLQNHRLGDLVGEGFTVVGEVHVEYIDTATVKELEAIETALKNGVIL